MRGRSPRTASLALAADQYRAALGDINGGALDTVLSQAGQSLGSAIDVRATKLENALKLIIALSGVAAAAGIINLLRGR